MHPLYSERVCRLLYLLYVCCLRSSQTDPSKHSYTLPFLSGAAVSAAAAAAGAADGIISTGTGDASVARGGWLSLIFLYTRSPTITDISTAPATAPTIAPIGTLAVVPLVAPLAGVTSSGGASGLGGGDGSATDGGGGGGGDGGGGDGYGGGGDTNAS